MTQGISDIEGILGLDFDTLEWTDLALCDGMDTNLFYDSYEADENVAKITDEICLSCPVRAQCLRRGVENNEWGVWGGVFLVNGTADEKKNAHKTAEVWNTIKEGMLV